ncbi:histidine/lysine/arginine/ornithine ABC transporter permease HisQ [Agarivorans sp. OAG1]|uniref:Arginine/ornithine ABC transporter n=1 Tax=Agarivorans albus MKT 106 TaxID=1331007 RepID=R9PRF8_AGAAL|nr:MULTISPECIES: ABC transporter permease [Agarivorans]MPW27631.1 ABC transporter permease subunit [Agarivorans sp. B2Z047]UQN44529.1 ABC transporter permease [Agarivorans sp. B2Z047]BEU04098.1 histidine/lysine/arginine/ornithine ABC transporter permease HisQ [Agarivorans sp. OAG1]GAD03939.1 arginine/ornithine ABC transporter [Agarivorans albus MKT 106]
MLDLHGYGPSIFMGAIVTIEVAFLSLAVALILGMLAAVARLSKNRIANGVAVVYTTVIRGVPDLVLMLLIFFGAQIMMNVFSDWLYDNFDIDYYININEFVAGVTTIGFIFGAYMAETFRGAFLAVDNGQIEAGKAYGMSSLQVFRRITVPQMMRHAIPGIGNNWLVLVKTTALVSVIGLADMVRLAKEAAGAVHEPFLFFIPVAFVYLALTSVSEIFLKRLEIRFSAGTVR